MSEARRWIGGATQPVNLAVRDSIEPIVNDFGCFLVGVELTTEGHRKILWVYIDRDDGGATIDDCAKLSPELSAMLDVTDPIAESYELRVSSPGLDRPLMTANDFDRFVGEPALIMLSTPLQGRRKFTGTVRGMDGDGVRVECSDGEHLVPLAYVQRARLKFDLKIGKEPRRN